MKKLLHKLLIITFVLGSLLVITQQNTYAESQIEQPLATTSGPSLEEAESISKDTNTNEVFDIVTIDCLESEITVIKDGYPVANTNRNIPYSEDKKTSISTYDSGEKDVIIPHSEKYKVVVVANKDGEMNVSSNNLANTKDSITKPETYKVEQDQVYEIDNDSGEVKLINGVVINENDTYNAQNTNLNLNKFILFFEIIAIILLTSFIIMSVKKRINLQFY